jgi:hypothetical protein
MTPERGPVWARRAINQCPSWTRERQASATSRPDAPPVFPGRYYLETPKFAIIHYHLSRGPTQIWCAKSEPVCLEQGAR